MYLWKHQQVKDPRIMHQLRFHQLIKVSKKYHLWHPNVHATSFYLEDVKLVLENFFAGPVSSPIIIPFESPRGNTRHPTPTPSRISPTTHHYWGMKGDILLFNWSEVV